VFSKFPKSLPLGARCGEGIVDVKTHRRCAETGIEGKESFRRSANTSKEAFYLKNGSQNL
jgi:hypothetical protein